MSRILLDPRGQISIPFQTAAKQVGSENLSSYLTAGADLVGALGVGTDVALGPLRAVLGSSFAGALKGAAATELSFNYSTTAPVLTIANVVGGRGTTKTVYDINAFQADSGGERKKGAPNILIGKLILTVTWDDSLLAPEDSSGLHFDNFNVNAATLTVFSNSIPPQTRGIRDILGPEKVSSVTNLTEDSTAQAVSIACSAIEGQFKDILNDLDRSAVLYAFYRLSPLARSGGKLSDQSDADCLESAKISALINMGMPAVPGYPKPQTKAQVARTT